MNTCLLPVCNIRSPHKTCKYTLTERDSIYVDYINVIKITCLIMCKLSHVCVHKLYEIVLAHSLLIYIIYIIHILYIYMYKY